MAKQFRPKSFVVRSVRNLGPSVGSPGEFDFLVRYTRTCAVMGTPRTKQRIFHAPSAALAAEIARWDI
jgi:hypothetical protein